jgi:hypothetical protein
MALDSKEISDTQKISDHQLVEDDFVKNKQQEPSEDFYELVMIDENLKKDKDHDKIFK